MSLRDDYIQICRVTLITQLMDVGSYVFSSMLACDVNGGYLLTCRVQNISTLSAKSVILQQTNSISQHLIPYYH